MQVYWRNFHHFNFLFQAILLCKNCDFSVLEWKIVLSKKLRCHLQKLYLWRWIIKRWWTFSTIIWNFQKKITKLKAKDGRWMSMPKIENSSEKPLKKMGQLTNNKWSKNIQMQDNSSMFWHIFIWYLFIINYISHRLCRRCSISWWLHRLFNIRHAVVALNRLKLGIIFSTQHLL